MPTDPRPDDGAAQPRSLNRVADAPRPDDGAAQPRSLNRVADTPRPDDGAAQPRSPDRVADTPRPDDGAAQPRSPDRVADTPRPDDGAAQPHRVVEARPASTILLLRDGAAGLEVFMVLRNRAIDFAGGALVFPGGRVEPADGSLGEPFRIAAIREAFEESGLLLARRGEAMLDAHSLPRDGDFHALLAEHALTPAADALVHYAHWITPPDMPKRFDTHFFLAEAPAGQIGLHDGGEAVESLWTTPARALADADAGLRVLVFATRLNLVKLARFATVGQALAGTGPVVTVCPQPFQRDGATWMRIPEAAGYGAGEYKAVARPMKPVVAR